MVTAAAMSRHVCIMVGLSLLAGACYRVADEPEPSTDASTCTVGLEDGSAKVSSSLLAGPGVARGLVEMRFQRSLASSPLVRAQEHLASQRCVRDLAAAQGCQVGEALALANAFPAVCTPETFLAIATRSDVKFISASGTAPP
jgi:hypothetical protein